MEFLSLSLFFKEDYPWVYELGKDLTETLKSRKSPESKEKAIRDFMNIIEMASRIMRYDKRMGEKDEMMLFHELPMIFERLMREISHQ